jgi:hypothetical protein
MTQPDAPATYHALRRLLRLVALGAVIGCGHSEPFDSRSFDTDQPFDPSPPVQLTLNRGPDRRPAWLPDGSGILYSTQPAARPDQDVCLGELPPTGGRLRALTCDLSPTGIDLTESLESAAPNADGRLAYVAATSQIGAVTPDEQGLVLGSVNDPATREVLLSIPYTIPGQRTHGGVSQVRWLSSDRLLYLGEAVSIITPCQFCQADTLRSGLDAVWLGTQGGEATPHAIPGTTNASGVSPGSGEDEVYYTLAGDTRVYRQLLSTGAVSQVYDFGPAGVARDVHVVGSRMAAVVGGRVQFADDPSLGPTQWDSGGTLHVVNLQDGTDVTLENPAPPMLFRRPQLSPSGSSVLVEGYPLIISPGPFPGSRDTTASRVGDLYLFGQP